MAQIETWLNQDMMQAVKVRYLDGNLFSQDNAGNLIGVKLTRDGEDYSGGGTVSANVIRADGGTVAVTGALSGNVATVVLPQSAYAVPGVVSIVVKLTVSGAIITIAAVVANIYQSSTETAIDPGTIIPSIQTLINQINTAVASIPADYSSLWETLAPAFSTSTAYTIGQYVTYDGGLYRFTSAHPAGAWSSSDTTAAVVGNVFTDLQTGKADKTDPVFYGTISKGRKGNSQAGTGSVALGDNVTANGWFSQAEGQGTIANGSYQRASGKYNVADTGNTYAEMVGNGYAEVDPQTFAVTEHRSNARTLDWNGNETLAGDLTVNKGTANEVTLGAEVSNLKNALTGTINLNGLLISGSYNSSGGVVTNPKRLRTNGFIDITPNDVITFNSGTKITGLLYGTFTESGTFISDSPWLSGEQKITVNENRKLILVFRAGDDSDISVSDFDATCVFENIIGSTKKELNEIIYSVTFDTMQDGMVSTDGIVYSSTSYKHTPFIYVPLNEGGKITVASTIYGNASLAFYDIHKNVIATVNGNNVAEYGTASSPYVLTRELQAPKNTQYICANINLQYGNISQFVLTGTGLSDVYNELNNRDILTLNVTESMFVNAGANYGHHSNGYSNIDKRFSALITTDIHGDSYALGRAVEYANLMPCFDCGFSIGDLQTGTFSDNDGTWYTDEIAKSRINWLTLVGNHDFGIGSAVSQTGTVAEVYNKFIQPNLRYAGNVVDSGSCYYYKDYTDYKIRLICLNPYDVNNYDTVGDNYVVNRYTEYYSQAQIDWLVNALNDTPSDYQVIIIVHSAPAETTKDTSVNFNNRELGLPNEGTQTDLITDIVNAWIAGAALLKTYTSTNAHLNSVNVSADFTSRGQGVFVCYLTGHQHIDFVGFITKYPNQKILSFSSTCMDRYQNGGRIDLPRADNTKAEDCITSFSVDTTNRYVYIVRIGSSMSKWFDKREPSVIAY